MVTEGAMRHALDKCGASYLGFALMIGSRGRLAKRQMFLSTFVAQYHGLSRLGMDMLAQLGFAMSSTSYDRAMTTCVQVAQTQFRFPVLLRACAHSSVGK